MTALEIVSDPICPWCFIGKRRIDAAARAAGVEILVRWEPFQLEPDLPPQGVDFRAQVLQRYGAAHDPAIMFRRLEEAGAPFGIRFAMERVHWLPQTLDAHRLLYWAGDEGDAQHRLADALFSERFERGGDIGDVTTLARLAGDVLGWDAAVTVARLGGDEDVVLIRQRAEANRDRGIRTIPHVTLAGRPFDHSAPIDTLAATLVAAAAPAAVAYRG